MNNFLKYLIIGVVFTTIVDYTTTLNPNFQKWVSYMPAVWIFYIVYPLIFAFLTQKKKWGDRDVFIAAVVSGAAFELLFVNNTLLVTFPIMLIMIPFMIAIYSFITLGPKWIVEKKVSANRKRLILLAAIWILVAVLNFVTKTRSG